MSPSTVQVPVLAIRMTSNSVLLALNVAVAHGIAAYCGEDACLFRPCEKTVAREFACTCFAL